MIRRLKKGDEITIAAPSSFIEDEKAFKEGLEILKMWGLKIKNNTIINRKDNYFAGNDEIRFSEIQQSQKSELIIFAKGGWGAARLLEKKPTWNNGWMIGFSDTCSLLLSKVAQGFMGSVHGPMISTLSREPEWSINRLKSLLFEGYVELIEGIPIKEGIAKGEIIVSNLTIASFLIGTNHLPDLNGKIVIFEDINEEIYKIDRMLTYFRISGKLKNIAGIGFVNFFNETPNVNIKSKFKKLIAERFKDFDIPIVLDLPIGHLPGNACIPMGFNASLNGYSGRLEILTKVD